MLNFLLVAAAAAAAQASDASTPPGLTDSAFTISPPRAGDVTHLLSIGTPERFLSIVCAPGRAQTEIYVTFPETIGFSVRTTNSGGYRVRYSFDGGEERRGDWSAAGNMAIAMGRYSGSNDLLGRLRGTHSVRLTVRRQAGGTQEINFSYPDPGPLIDEFVLRCGLNLER